MDLTNFVCIYLMTCFPSDKDNYQIIDGCPNHCECYTAPEDGDGLDTAYSMICSFKGDFIDELADNLRNKPVNTLIVDNAADDAPYSFIFTPGFQLNNLVLMNSHYSRYKLPVANLDKDKLNVLTLIDTTINTNWLKIEWIPSGFKQLKAIFIRGGSFDIFDNRLVVDSMNGVISLTVNKTGLKTITDNALSEFKSLKIIKITQNQIVSLSWLPVNCPIWYLDVRNNRIREFPLELAQALTKLRILMLGGNNIHHIGYDTAQILMNQLREFTFEPVKGTTDENIFYPTKDMIWICTHETCADDTPKNYPRLLYNDLKQSNCIKWNENGVTKCGLFFNYSYNYPEEAITNRLAIINFNGFSLFSYMNNFNYLVGAELPPNWINDANYEDWMKLVSTYGNVVKLQIDMQQWYSFNDPDKFKDMISSLETSIKIAQKYQLFVIINLWKYNSAVETFIMDENVRQKYLEEHLDVLADKLRIYDNIAGWNILSTFIEPVQLTDNNAANSEICLNAKLINPTAGPNRIVDFEPYQKFIALQAQKIHQKAPGHLVTATIADTLSFWKKNKIGFNYFENKCLNLVMDNKCNKKECELDFYSVLVSKDKIEDPEYKNFNQTYISKESVKPVVLVAVADNDGLKSLIDNGDVGHLWKFEGILGRITEKTATEADRSNQMLQNSLNSFHQDHQDLIFKFGFVNPILKDIKSTINE